MSTPNRHFHDIIRKVLCNIPKYRNCRRDSKKGLESVTVKEPSVFESL